MFKYQKLSDKRNWQQWTHILAPATARINHSIEWIPDALTSPHVNFAIMGAHLPVLRAPFGYICLVSIQSTDRSRASCLQGHTRFGGCQGWVKLNVSGITDCQRVWIQSLEPKTRARKSGTRHLWLEDGSQQQQLWSRFQEPKCLPKHAL